jgi:very-short-patch-repair endonuclease
MKPEDALGGLLRADQIVVVGDPKQLPPTDFFTRTGAVAGDLLDEEIDELDDESILQACHNAFRQVRRLKWHYRSRCESLIAFSNRMFYGNGLITFPSARLGSFSIDLVRLDGVHQARRNVVEAACIAEAAADFMRQFAGADKDEIPTLGIAAVNLEQRDLIAEELRRLCAGDDAIDRYRAKVEEKGEPLFVKNLENVQGDERDHIFVSLTYGRSPESAAMRQHFGPINGKYGHRRLNVLFSRARARLVLFSSFGSADVLPTEKSHEGVRVLKRYLEYVENRGFVETGPADSEPDSDFEIAVVERLRGRGYTVDCQVGASGFRIDLAVRHPEDQTRFLAGIECDGASYHSSKSARDRDRLREQFLRDLGWQILRVWSTDWFENPDAEADKLARKLDQLLVQPPRAVDDRSIATESAAWANGRDGGPGRFEAGRSQAYLRENRL